MGQRITGSGRLVCTAVADGCGLLRMPDTPKRETSRATTTPGPVPGQEFRLSEDVPSLTRWKSVRHDGPPRPLGASQAELGSHRHGVRGEGTLDHHVRRSSDVTPTRLMHCSLATSTAACSVRTTRSASSTSASNARTSPCTPARRSAARSTS